MGKAIKIIIGIIVIVIVVAAIYFYALPKGSTKPQSAVSTKALHKRTFKLNFKPSSSKVSALAAKTAYFQQGLNSAQHKLYVILDPNCIWCHRLFEMLQTPIAQGNVAVRWIVIGAVRPSSPGKAKSILGSPSPIAALRMNESMFKENIEEGGISPAYSVSQQVLAKFNQNMDFATAVKLNVTPVVFFYDQAGQYVRYEGGVPPAQFKEWISHAGDKF